MPFDQAACVRCGRAFTVQAKPRWCVAGPEERYRVLGLAHTACGPNMYSTPKDDPVKAQYWVWLGDIPDRSPFDSPEYHACYLGRTFDSDAWESLQWWVNRPNNPIPPGQVPLICAAWLELQRRFETEVDVYQPDEAGVEE